MRTDRVMTFAAPLWNCQFRLLKVDPKSGSREQRTPGYVEIDMDYEGAWEPVSEQLMDELSGRMIDITQRMFTQFTEDATALPVVNDRLRIVYPGDSSGLVYTINSIAHYDEHHYEMSLERYMT